MAVIGKQCACGKVCGNGGALANHKKSKSCPLNAAAPAAVVPAVPVAAPVAAPVVAEPPAQVAVPEDEYMRTKIRLLEREHELKIQAELRLLELEHELKVRAMGEISKNKIGKSNEEMMRAKFDTTRAEEEAKKAASLRKLETKRVEVETNRVAVETELMKELKSHEFRLIDEKIVRVRRTGDVYVDHVNKMTKLAEEDAHQLRLLTMCPHLLTRDEMQVFGTAYMPCYERRDINRFIDTHLAAGEGEKNEVKALVGKMALRQDVTVDKRTESMLLVPLRSITRITRMSEDMEDMEDAEDAEEEQPGAAKAEAAPVVEGNRMVLSFAEQEELTLAIKAFCSREASEVDAACVTAFFANMAAAASKAVASVTRHRVHLPSVLQEMVDEQVRLKARRTTHNRYEFWAKKTGGAQQYPCETCGCSLTVANFEMGHRVAKARGGSFDLNNMMVQCGTCNGDQGVLHPELFKDTLVV